MDFATTPEQDALREMVRKLLAARSPEQEVRRLMSDDRAWDTGLWSEMADLGLLGLAVPEDLGGAACGALEVAIVAEEAGATLLVGPWFPTVVLGVTTLLELGGEHARSLLPRIVAGELTATLAFTEGGIGRDLARTTTTAVPGPDGGWLLDGRKDHVVDGASADLLLVVARTPDGLGTFAVTGEHPGVRRTPLPTLDRTRRQASIDLARVPATLVGTGPDTGTALSTVLDVAGVCLAAEQVGGMERSLAMAVEYAKVRHQFGRPIGSFQAIKHTCADMLVDVEAARSAAYYGVWAAATGAPDLPLAASVAGSWCSEAFCAVTAKNIQVHGGIGFTWEHPAHLYFKRARGSSVLFGDAVRHRDRLATLAGFAPTR